ncbi:MAG TPA: MerR family transcriptional regulator [Candidatus Dormibacteraeota bacterium]
MKPAETDIRLDQLAKVTGLSPVLIRAWERRYGVPVPSRTEGGHRRYSREQAELVRRAALLVRSGLRAAEAIARARTEGAPAPPLDLVEVAELAELLVGGDAVQALDRLRAAWLALGFDATLEELALPALRDIGVGWASGRYSVAEEHVATGVVMSWLGTVRSELPATDLGAPRYLLATPEGEQHGLAVWALELLLRLRGVPSRALGASVPTDDLAQETRRFGVAGVVLGVARPALRRAAISAGRRVAQATNGGVTVYLGGAGAPDQVAGLLRLPPSLTAAADFLARVAQVPAEQRLLRSK